MYINGNDKTSNRSLGKKNERADKFPIKQKNDIDWLNRKFSFLELRMAGK